MNVFKMVNSIGYLTDGEGTVTAGNNNGISVVGCFGYKPFKVIVKVDDVSMSDTFETKVDAVKYFKSVTRILKGE